MICGIGIDLVESKRMARIMRRWRDRFTQRVFTAGERRYCDGMRMPEMHYSARFAAKEAFLKSTGIGLGGGIRLADIEVEKKQRQMPVLILHGKAKELARERGITNFHVSLTHTGNYATAIVILEK